MSAVLKISRLRNLSAVPPKAGTFCLFCGCTEAHACAGGCVWLLRSRSKEWGVCSACGADLKELNERLERAKSMHYFACPGSMRYRG